MFPSTECTVSGSLSPVCGAYLKHQNNIQRQSGHAGDADRVQPPLSTELAVQQCSLGSVASYLYYVCRRACCYYAVVISTYITFGVSLTDGFSRLPLPPPLSVRCVDPVWHEVDGWHVSGAGVDVDHGGHGGHSGSLLERSRARNISRTAATLSPRERSQARLPLSAPKDEEE